MFCNAFQKDTFNYQDQRQQNAKETTLQPFVMEFLSANSDIRNTLLPLLDTNESLALPQDAKTASAEDDFLTAEDVSELMNIHEEQEGHTPTTLTLVPTRTMTSPIPYIFPLPTRRSTRQIRTGYNMYVKFATRRDSANGIRRQYNRNEYMKRVGAEWRNLNDGQNRFENEAAVFNMENGL
jgi:hypothetical protein